jgi:hypothetical protein
VEAGCGDGLHRVLLGLKIVDTVSPILEWEEWDFDLGKRPYGENDVFPKELNR